MSRLERLLRFLEENIKNGRLDFWGDGNVQTFFSRNILGDEMETIYKNDGVIVDVCYGYCYIEIFGLNEKEQEQIMNSKYCYR